MNGGVCSAKSTAAILDDIPVKDWICRFAVLFEILSDQSKVNAIRYCKILEVRETRITWVYLDTDRIVARMNRTINRQLFKVVCGH